MQTDVTCGLARCGSYDERNQVDSLPRQFTGLSRIQFHRKRMESWLTTRVTKQSKSRRYTHDAKKNGEATTILLLRE